MNKQLKRSRNNQMIAGVCGGLGEFFGISTSLIRFFWLIFVFMSDTPAILIYIILAVILPEDQGEDIIYNESDDYDSENSKTSKTNSSFLVGLSLIIIGLYFLVDKIWPTFFDKFSQLTEYWPVLLIVIGFYIIFKKDKNS